MEMIRRLRRDELTEEDFVYIEDEKRTREEVGRLERGIYEDGKKDGEKIGIEKGQAEIVISMIKNGMDIEAIAKITGLSHSKLEEIMKTGTRL
jgi:predicted transposase/invertase (TIGR01784 family)